MLSDNAIQILESRYLRRNEHGELTETPEGMFRRVARTLADREEKYGGPAAKKHWEATFFRVMTDLDFLPNSPTLMNAGMLHGQLSACFVLPLADSLDAIFDTLKAAALIHQSGGGTGFNFSPLRPRGDRILTAGGVSSGPVSFMQIFDAATEHIRQGGRRRGANMGILDIDHPDIEEFITAKSDKKSLRNFNLSVNVPDAFMAAVEKNDNWILYNPRNGEPVRTLPARQLWDLIVEQAWRTGDPGLIFTDTVNRHNPTPALGPITCTNPCGEVPLLGYESCNLGSINLAHMLRSEGPTEKIDYPKLERTVEIATRLLDDVIEANYFTLEEVRQMSNQNRKIGLGVMGWAEMLIRLNIPYASEEAVQLGGRLMKLVNEKSREASALLASERGVFPAWPQSIYAPAQPLRNATRTSIAPTGTISILADTTSSIEPLFALAYRRVGILENQSQWEISRVFREKAITQGLWSEKMAEHLLKQGDVTGLPSIPPLWQELFQTSLDIPWAYHLRHQAAFQQFTDNAVSKTINFPTEATRQDIAEAFQMAWRLQAKGITVYRYGSRSHQVLQRGKKEDRSC